MVAYKRGEGLLPAPANEPVDGDEIIRTFAHQVILDETARRQQSNHSIENVYLCTTNHSFVP